MSDKNNNNSQVDSIISAISLINTALSIPVELPVSGGTIQFRQLTTAQEKRLVKDLLTNKTSTFLAAILPILQENCENKNVSLKDLTIVDLYAIILKIRIYSIGEEITLKIPYKKPKTGSFTTKVHLMSIYDQLIKNIKKMDSMDFNIELSPYKVYCSIPKIKEILESSSENIDTFYDTLFIETARMVTRIDIISNSGEVKPIDFQNFSIGDKIKILENIPNATLTKVYAESVKKIKGLKDLMLFDFVFEGEKYKQNIDLMSPDFFTVF